jgi:hypothetical protein
MRDQENQAEGERATVRQVTGYMEFCWGMNLCSSAETDSHGFFVERRETRKTKDRRRHAGESREGLRKGGIIFFVRSKVKNCCAGCG